MIMLAILLILAYGLLTRARSFLTLAKCSKPLTNCVRLVIVRKENLIMVSDSLWRVRLPSNT